MDEIPKEKFQAIFTMKLKKPKFGADKNTTPKEGLNYEMPNYSRQKKE